MIKNFDNIIKIMNFINAINVLKFEMRFGKDNSHLDNIDSVASHTWRMSVLTFLLAEHLDIDVDINRCIKMSLIHDLPEAVVGDTAFSEVVHNSERLLQKSLEEKEAMQSLSNMLPDNLAKEVYNLWLEYEECQTDEAKFVKVMDKVEAAYQSMHVGVDRLCSKDASAMHTNKVYGWFDETDEIIKYVKNEMKKDFESKGLLWKDIYDVG